MANVASVLLDMKAKGVIDKYAVGGASAVAFYTEPIATKDGHLLSFRTPAERLYSLT